MISQPNTFEYQTSNNSGGYPEEPKNKTTKTLKNIFSTIGIIIAAPLIALLLINFVFQTYEVDGPSMEGTLQDGDRLIVLKAGRTIAEIKDEPYIPDRHSIIIFHSNEADLSSADRQLIKRVVALPGERVIVRDGRVTVYNSDHPNGFNPDSGTDYERNIPGQTPLNVDLTVPAGEVFVLGDNRINSKDSRSFGTVPSESIVGELVLRIYPFSEVKTY